MCSIVDECDIALSVILTCCNYEVLEEGRGNPYSLFPYPVSENVTLLYYITFLFERRSRMQQREIWRFIESAGRYEISCCYERTYLRISTCSLVFGIRKGLIALFIEQRNNWKSFYFENKSQRSTFSITCSIVHYHPLINDLSTWEQSSRSFFETYSQN